MGKNQAYKAMQRSKMGSTSGGPEEIEDGMTQVDGSFHSPEWHAARLANLKTSHTVTWEEFRKKQKEEELKKGEQEADKDKMMRDYRALLDAEREKKLSQGRNHADKLKCKKDKDKSSRKRSGRKKKQHYSRKRSPDDSSSSDSSTEESSSSDEERKSRRSKSKTSKSKRTKKERKHRSKRKRSTGNDEGEEENGPLPLSRFFGNTKS
ncbi:hypothetical protein V2J09_006302 [Rumex salicifolius]